MDGIGRKIWKSFWLIVLLACIGGGVFLVKKYINTDAGRTLIYKTEINDVLNLEGNKTLIKILKQDINNDGIEDYAILLGEEKFEDNDTTKITDLKKLMSTVEMYNNICVDILDGSTREMKRYDTKKSYGSDVGIEIKSDKDTKYVVVSDTTTGNVALLYLQEAEIKNLIADSFSQEFCGYTIEAGFNKEDPTKLNVSLDNYGRDYLTKQESTFVLDYTDTNVNSENYRVTYMANRFCVFEIVQDENQNLELIGIQHILYSNNNSVEKNSGKIKTHFKLDENKKLVFNNVEVIK